MVCIYRPCDLEALQAVLSPELLSKTGLRPPTLSLKCRAFDQLWTAYIFHVEVSQTLKGHLLVEGLGLESLSGSWKPGSSGLHMGATSVFCAWFWQSERLTDHNEKRSGLVILDEDIYGSRKINDTITERHRNDSRDGLGCNLPQALICWRSHVSMLLVW